MKERGRRPDLPLQAMISSEVMAGGTVKEISTDLSDPSPYQNRRHFDAEALIRLAASMEDGGLVNLVIVRSMPDGRYELVAGERRWRAAMLNKQNVLMAIVKVMSDHETMRAVVVDNEAREDVSDFERGEGYKRLMDEGLAANVSDLARLVGKERTFVGRCLDYFNLPIAVQTMLQEQPNLFGSRYVSEFNRYSKEYPELVTTAVEKILRDGKDALFAVNWLKGEIRRKSTPTAVPSNKTWKMGKHRIGDVDIQGRKLIIKLDKGVNPDSAQRLLSGLWDDAPADVRAYLDGRVGDCLGPEE